MIFWISGNTGTGKTYLANRLIMSMKNPVWLDGDMMRNVWRDLGLSKADRWEHNLRIARLAELMNRSHDVVVSVIAPYAKLREEISKICNPTWIFTPSYSTDEKPYELPIPRGVV